MWLRGEDDSNMHALVEPLNSDPAIWGNMQVEQRLRLHTLCGRVEKTPTSFLDSARTGDVGNDHGPTYRWHVLVRVGRVVCG